jgi:two-component system, NtrC family, response regulator AtoC
MSSRDRILDEASTTQNPAGVGDDGPRIVAVWNGGSLSQPLPARGTLLIGRTAEAGIRLDHPSVSRRHAMLVLDGERMRLDDLGGSNGTFLNGQRLAPRSQTWLSTGALVEVGSVLLVVKDAARSAPPRSPPSPDLVLADPKMTEVYQQLEMVAKSSLSVILLGETGSGKELCATRVHQLSPRAAHPFLKVNCAALVETLLEAELFGYERGAFTGATQAKAGLLESAHGGTLFLDEVGETPLSTQAKLLRVLESGEVVRVGAVKPRSIDVRFVSATNRNLRDLVTQGSFRQDLFFRLDGISISIPPLRDRPSEISELTRAFLASAAQAASRRPLDITPEAMRALQNYPWPGNVRELRNVITRSVLLCKTDRLELEDLRFEGFGASAASPPPPMSPLRPSGPAQESARAPVPSVSLSPADEEERQRVADALQRSAGNQTRAAKLLGMSRRTMLKRLDALGLPRPRKSDPDGT